ncbi:MAG: hypothetical protein WCP09_03720 [Candidatus Taylorbacteria bacterium]
MKAEKNFFRKNFRYVLVLGALAWIVYTMPSVRAALQTIDGIDKSQESLISLIPLESQVAAVYSSGRSSDLPPQPRNCPSGYVCIPTSMISTWCPVGYQCTAQKPSIVSASVSPLAVSIGQQATLSWTSVYADFCYASNINRGSKLPASGVAKVGPFAVGTTTINLVCGKNGSLDLTDQKMVYLIVLSSSTPPQTALLRASNLATKYGPIVGAASSATTTQPFYFSFNLTAGNYPMYISTDQNSAVTTTGNLDGMGAYSSGLSANSTGATDSSSYYYIAPGQTRSFISSYMAVAPRTGSGTYYVTSINYGTSTQNTSAMRLASPEISAGLRALLFH